MGCYNSVIVSAPAATVWNALKNFHDLSWSKNVISKVDIIGDKSQNEIGAKRVLNDAFHETLQTLDNDARNFTYSIDDGPGPLAKGSVTGYIGEVTVLPITENDTSFVLWTSEWESPKDGSVFEFCNPIYLGLLSDLKMNFSLKVHH